jgi:hypothetical protein
MTKETAETRVGKGVGSLLDLFFLVAKRVAFDFLVVVLVLVFIIVRNDVDAHGVHLDHFDLRLALRAIQNFAFLYFFFVNIDLDGTFRTTHHSWTSNQG